MALKKDKQKILGEVFDDERIKTFLQFQPPEGVNADYHILEKAYRGMVAENFDRFLTIFLGEGRDIDAKNPAGKSLLQILKEHRHAEEYVRSLKNHGAREDG